jgi:hypothetical protein
VDKVPEEEVDKVPEEEVDEGDWRKNLALLKTKIIMNNN